jgi:hypothetical protein
MVPAGRATSRVRPADRSDPRGVRKYPFRVVQCGLLLALVAWAGSVVWVGLVAWADRVAWVAPAGSAVRVALVGLAALAGQAVPVA